MAKNCIGLDLGSSAVKLTQVKKGEVDSIVKPGSNHQIQTSVATATAIGTQWDTRCSTAQCLFIVVEGAVKVTSKKGAATKTTGYCMPSQAAVVLARPGGLMGMEGIPEFSTIQGFFYEEFTVETLDECSTPFGITEGVTD